MKLLYWILLFKCLHLHSANVMKRLIEDKLCISLSRYIHIYAPVWNSHACGFVLSAFPGKCHGGNGEKWFHSIFVAR